MSTITQNLGFIEPKWWMDSTTVRGALLTIAPTIVAILHLFSIQILNDEITLIVEGLAGLAGLAGAVMAIVGRSRSGAGLTFGFKKN